MRRLQPHPRERPPPGLDLRQLGLRPARQPRVCPGRQLRHPLGHVGIAGDPRGQNHAGGQLMKVGPDLRVMPENHAPQQMVVHQASLPPLAAVSQAGTEPSARNAVGRGPWRRGFAQAGGQARHHHRDARRHQRGRGAAARGHPGQRGRDRRDAGQQPDPAGAQRGHRRVPEHERRHGDQHQVRHRDEVGAGQPGRRGRALDHPAEHAETSPPIHTECTETPQAPAPAAARPAG